MARAQRRGGTEVNVVQRPGQRGWELAVVVAVAVAVGVAVAMARGDRFYPSCHPQRTQVTWHLAFV